MTRLAIVLAALVLPLFAASPAQAAVRTEFFGIVQGVLDEQDRDGLEAAKVQTERFLLKWRELEPTRGVYNWDARDRFIGALAANGIRPVPFVWGSPRWVTPGTLAQPPSTAADEQAWRNFLTAAVARYGPGGTYWAPGGKYDQQFPAPRFKDYPIESWQIWNEPNLKKFFTPGQTVQQSARKYARLLDISRNAIKARDPNARIVFAGMPGVGDSTAWIFLRNVYAVPGAKADFDAAALHPYSCSVEGVRQETAKFRAEMTSHADGATPLWLTEFAWGSGVPTPSDPKNCKNKGLTGQRDLLTRTFRLILQNRRIWNVQRLYWFLWRDPPAGSNFAKLCTICGTAGLLRNDRSPKPAYHAFRSFTAETTPPVANITAGPAQGSFTKDSTPTFSFTSNEPGSTFVCRWDAGSFNLCSSPHTRGTPLSNGAHTFSVKAIDAPGNVSAIRSRSFTVDTTPPQTTITSGPSGTTSDRTPTFTFTSSESGSTFRCRFDSQAFGACSGPGASHTPSTPLSLGTHTFQVRAIDKAKNPDLTPSKRSFTVIP